MAHYSLVASSTLFLGPTVYGFYRGHRILPATTLLATAVSVVYWLDPQSTEKRAFDLILSKSLGVMYFVYGWKHIESPSVRIYGYMNMIGILTTYQTVCSLYPGPYWVPCHMMFHYMVALGQFIVIHSTQG
jgi:hypothetical protein